MVGAGRWPPSDEFLYCGGDDRRQRARRVEDSLYIGPGKLAKSNAEQVAKIRRIIEDLGFEIATPAEARQMLGLKGADRVKF